MSVVSEIERIKGNIASAYGKAEEKGAVLPSVRNSDGLAGVIESIPQGVSEEGWRPEADWWDIERILEEDKEDYEGKMIVLLADVEVESKINRLGADKIVMSDGVEYTDVTVNNYSHVWDEMKDKDCSLGYKTRYVMYYYTNKSVFFSDNLPKGALYVIMKDFENARNALNYNPNTNVFGNNNLIERIKFKNVSFANFSIINLPNRIQEMDEIISDSYSDFTFASTVYPDFNKMDVKKITSFYTGIFNNTIFRDGVFDIEDFPWDRLINWNNLFSGAFVRVIKRIDMESCNSNFGVFNTSSLIVIGEILNIKVNGLSFSQCGLLNHATLLRILNALYDYSADGGTHTITLGATNLAKLSEEEIAIGQNKGWTIS